MTYTKTSCKNQKKGLTLALH